MTSIDVAEDYARALVKRERASAGSNVAADLAKARQTLGLDA